MALNSSNFFMFLIGIPLYSFHVSVALLLFWKLLNKHNPVCSVYYFIFFLLCLADIGYLIFSVRRFCRTLTMKIFQFFGFRMPDLGVFQDFYSSHGYLAGICWNAINTFSSIQYMGRLILCLNRFSYFFSPRYFDKVGICF